MTKEFTCIVCPNGCQITAQWDGSRVGEISGALCPRGAAYVSQELTAPKRNIATSVRVQGGVLPLASVRLTAPIPKEAIFPALQQIQQLTLTAPVETGTVILRGLLGYDSDVIVTRGCEKA